MSDAKPKTGQCSKREAKRRMDDALRCALSTPHQPHKSSGKSKASPKSKARKSDGTTTGSGGRVLHLLLTAEHFYMEFLMV